jgi:propionyl-CoA carboxylase beta chain
MGPEGAVEIIFKKEFDESEDHETAASLKVEEYKEKFANPIIAAEKGYVDEIIFPEQTRAKLIKGLQMLSNKRDANPYKKHGNMPL